MKRLSLKAGLSESAVRDAVNRGRAPSVDTFVKLATAAGVSPSVLLQGDERFHLKIPLVGVATGAEAWTPFEETPDRRARDTVDFELGDTDILAIEIRGNAMSPVYRDRDQLFCHRRTGSYVDNLVGLDCVLRTADGDNLVKILAKGSKPGLFNLKSYNPLARELENIALEWAAPIVWIRRGGR